MAEIAPVLPSQPQKPHRKSGVIQLVTHDVPEAHKKVFMGLYDARTKGDESPSAKKKREQAEKVAAAAGNVATLVEVAAGIGLLGVGIKKGIDVLIQKGGVSGGKERQKIAHAPVLPAPKDERISLCKAPEFTADTVPFFDAKTMQTFVKDNDRGAVQEIMEKLRVRMTNKLAATEKKSVADLRGQMFAETLVDAMSHTTDFLGVSTDMQEKRFFADMCTRLMSNPDNVLSYPPIARYMFKRYLQYVVHIPEINERERMAVAHTATWSQIRFAGLLQFATVCMQTYGATIAP